MVVAKVGKSKQKKVMHYSVGAIIKYGNRYLLISRKNPPLGYAGVAGHVLENETPEEALARVVKERVGMRVQKAEQLFEEELDWNWCNQDVDIHYWNLYRCEVAGEPRKGLKDIKTIDWYSPEDIQTLQLEKVWKYWFEKLNVIKP